MALVESIHLPLGSKMPEFSLNDCLGQAYAAKDCLGRKGLLIIFTCNHCPYAIAVWPRLIVLSKLAKDLGIETIAINPNINPAYPDDSPDNMKAKVKEWGITFPYLVDQDQSVARDFKAQCTPDIYLYDQDAALVYHGRVDDNWKDESGVTRQELKEAIEALAAGNPVSSDQRPSMGCSIKWC